MITIGILLVDKIYFSHTSLQSLNVLKLDIFTVMAFKFSIHVGAHLTRPLVWSLNKNFHCNDRVILLIKQVLLFLLRVYT